jgi:hypothetical protein
MTPSGLARISLEGDEWSSPQQIAVIAIYRFRDLWKKKMIPGRGKASRRAPWPGGAMHGN